jgi:hypothetical protein
VRCARDHYPFEEANGLSGSQFTTGAKLVIAERAADVAYAEASRSLDEERALPVSAKEVDRTVREVAAWRIAEERAVTEATYGPKASEALYKDQDPLAGLAQLHGFAGWRSETRAMISVDAAKVRSPVLGPKGLDWFDDRAGVINPLGEDAAASKVFVAGVCDPDAIFDLLAATWRQGGNEKCACAFIADGAPWIWNRVPTYFPKAVQILDVYHAAEHVTSAAVAWRGADSKRAQHWRKNARSLLLAPDGLRKVLRKLLRALRSPDKIADIKELTKEVRYLHGNRHRMNYAAYQAAGWPVGSGQMESAIKQLSTARLRGPGMKWTKQGADAMLRLRSAHLSSELRGTAHREHARLLKATTRYDHTSMARAA